MDFRQFNKISGNKSTGAVSRIPKTNPNPNAKGIKTFSAGFSKPQSNQMPPRKTPGFGIWTDQMSAQVGKEKFLFERKQEQKRRIAIEAIKLAEQRNRAMLERNNIENEVPLPVVSKTKKGVDQNTTRRALFSLDLNQPSVKVVKPIVTAVPKLPPIKEMEPLERPRGRPILKAKAFSGGESKEKLFSLPVDLMKDLKLEKPVKKGVVRYSIKDLKEMNPLKSHPKFKGIYE